MNLRPSKRVLKITPFLKSIHLFLSICCSAFLVRTEKNEEGKELGKTIFLVKKQ